MKSGYGIFHHLDKVHGKEIAIQSKNEIVHKSDQKKGNIFNDENDSDGNEDQSDFNDLVCEFCHQKFKYMPGKCIPFSYKKHMKLCEKFNMYVEKNTICKFCDRKFTKNLFVLKHVKKEHEKTCIFCKRIFKTENPGLINHLAKFHTKGVFISLRQETSILRADAKK